MYNSISAYCHDYQTSFTQHFFLGIHVIQLNNCLIIFKQRSEIENYNILPITHVNEFVKSRKEL